MTLNSVTNEYYIDVDDVLAETTYSSDELGRVFGVIDKELKLLSRAIYRLIYDWYPGLNKSDHITYMQEKIVANANNEQRFLKYAMIEMVKGAIESGMDLNAYLNEPKDTYPPTVYSELRSARLLDKTRKPVL